ncbi:MAG TPA: hypothetical protein VFR76_04595 [Verrucomicrobiae bacterium]|nr:hypothetical protein [Verrucomicrobiae bacterium]
MNLDGKKWPQLIHFEAIRLAATREGSFWMRFTLSAFGALLI